MFSVAALFLIFFLLGLGNLAGCGFLLGYEPG